MGARIDVVMAERGLVPSREKARALIMAGVVYCGGKKVDKAGTAIAPDAEIEIRDNPLPFVSRGGLKLQKAMQVFPITLEGCYALDIGASTGGFTDCMLQSGARHVCALDVGYGQLAWKLRNDPRVTVMERTNARYMEPAWYQEVPDFASIDVSFISLRLILPPLFQCLAEDGGVVALIKPQFEAGRAEVGKNGVVRDPEVHAAVIERMLTFAVETGYIVKGLDFSPIKGPEGNIEFLLYLKKTGEGLQLGMDAIKAVVASAHKEAGAHAASNA